MAGWTVVPNGDTSAWKPVKPEQPAAMPRPQGDLGQHTQSLSDRLTQITPDSPRMGLGERALNFVSNVGAGGMGLILHPIDAITGMAKSVIPGTSTPNPIEGLYQGLNTAPADTTASLIGQAAVTGGVGELAKPVSGAAGRGLTAVGGKMQDAGAGVINRTVGALQKDFKRGANPGRAYLDAGGGPAMSMDSLAGKGSALKGNVGAKIGSAIDASTNRGVTIPASKVSAAINPPIQNARGIISGPGGTGNLGPIDTFESSFNPTLYPSVTDSGSSAMLTPRSVFDMKKNVAENTNWSDPTQFGMKKLQQQTTGALGGVLADAVPELQDLNPQYQGLTNFAARANLRAQTGSSPLTHLATKTTLGAGGALLGATHSPLTAALTGAGAIALDSVPVKTAVGSGLFYGGKGLVNMGKGIRGLYSPPVLPPRRP